MSARRFRRLVAAAALALGTLLATAAVAGASGDLVLRVKDRCEPVSFNAVIGPGTCIGDGNVTFSTFIAQLMNHQQAFAWSFKPGRASVPAGKNVRAENIGGEFHTVTRVAEFGGGFVPELNELSGNPIPAPECFAGPGPTSLFLPAGGSGVFTSGATGALVPGENKLLCCIHPWMRSTISVRDG